jgi:putative oxidoreductase
MRIAKEVALWVMALFLVYVFTKAGIQKFSDTSGWARAFHAWGYPVWFRVLIGIIEVAAAALLLYRPLAALGALLITFVMLGAMGTHVFVQHRPSQATNEIFLLVLALLVLTGRSRPWITATRAFITHKRRGATAGGR